VANLVITSVCNLHCDYCFARDALGEAEDGAFISLRAFQERLDFLERSNIKDARLIGGEPGLHPRFGELIQLAEQRFQNIVVFTNGVLNDQALEALEGLPPDRLTVMVNLSTKKATGVLGDVDQSRRALVLHRLGTRAMTALTIERVDFDFEPFLPLILESGRRKSVRLGLAQPVVGGSNLYLHPKLYPEAGKRIARFAQKAAALGLRLEFDCGFVRCMFTEEDLEKLTAAEVYDEKRCNAVLDIDLAGQVSHCFPLAKCFTVQLEGQTCATELRESFAVQTRPYRLAGIYKDCSTCIYKSRQECTGGCLAATMLRFQGSWKKST
jgi:hypothetical protein